MLKAYVAATNAVSRGITRFKKDMEGASLVEYSLLIGLISAAVVLLIVSIGGKVNTSWTKLDTAYTP